MKKYYLSMLSVAACLALPMSALATGTIDGATSLGGTVAFAPSKSVSLSVTSTAVAYAATALHTQGTEVYGILSSDTKVKFSTVTPVANQTAASVAATTSATALPTVTNGTAWADK